MWKYLFIFSFFFSTSLYGQTIKPVKPDCNAMLKEGDRLMQLADPPLDEALKAYLNALNCNSKLSSVVGPKIEEVFHLIKEQKRFAEEQQGIAKQQTKIAQQQRTIAQIEAIRAKASLYANLATREKQKGNFESGMRLAMKAWQMLPDPKPAFAYEAFTSNGFAQRDSFFMLTKRLEQNSFAAFAPDNQTFLTIQDSIIHHWDLNINLLVSLKHREVKRVRFSPNSQKILTLSKDKSAKLWDLKGQLLHNLTEIDDYYEDPGFSPNSQMVLSVHEDKTAKLWDLQGKMLLSFAEIQLAKFSPDGQIILGASKEGINLWDLQGNLLTELKQKEVWEIEFAPDGKKVLAISGEEGEEIINLWDLQGQLLTNFKPRRSFDEVYSAEFAPDGQIIVLSCSEDDDPIDDEWFEYFDLKGNNLGRLRGNDYDIHFNPDGKKTLKFSDGQQSVDLQHIKSWEIVETLTSLKHAEPIYQPRLSPDEQKIVTLSGGQNTNLWATKKNLMVLLVEHPNQYRSVQFSPNRKLILTFQANKTKTAKLWDLQGNLVANLEEPTDTIISAQFSPNGQMVVTRTHSKVKLWALNSDLLVELKHKDRISGIQFSPDEQMILTYARDTTVKLWDLQGNLIADINKDATATYSVRFSPDGQRILIKDKESITLWGLKGNFLADLKAPNMPNFSPNGEMMLSLLWNDTTREYTTKLQDFKGNLLFEAPLRIGFSPTVKFTRDNQSILLTGSDSRGYVRNVRLWDLEGKTLVEWRRYPVFSPDDQLILNYADNTVKLWDLNGKVVATLEGCKGFTRARFSPDGRYILTHFGNSYSSRIDNTVKLWNLKGKLLASMEGHTGNIESAEFLPDGQRILTISNDKTAKLWDLRGHLLADMMGHKDIIRSVKISSGGRHILTHCGSSSNDHTIKLWNPQGRLLADMDKHTDKVSEAIFSPNSQYILTTSRDKTVKLWDLQGHLLANLDKFPDGINSAEFLSNGRYILTRSKEGAKLWPMPAVIQEWIDDFGEIPFTKGEKLKYGME